VVVNNPYIWGTGRRKTASARVRIKAGTGKFMVNGLEFEKFFLTHDTRRSAAMPLTVTETRNSYDIWCNVIGGGITGQSGAVSLGISRALCLENVNFEKLLRENGLMTRDSREVERKKYGRHKARRSTQFSKR
jgi:small subunit ribosomal protein S9